MASPIFIDTKYSARTAKKNSMDYYEYHGRITLEPKPWNSEVAECKQAQCGFVELSGRNGGEMSPTAPHASECTSYSRLHMQWSCNAMCSLQPSGFRMSWQVSRRTGLKWEKPYCRKVVARHHSICQPSHCNCVSTEHNLPVHHLRSHQRYALQ